MTETLIKLRRSAVPGKTPTDSQLELGEVAINTYDGKMYFKQAATSNTILQVATTSLNLSQFASTTSAQLASIITNETGTGSLVFGTSPILVTPVINGNTTFDSGTLFVDSVANRVGINTISPQEALQVQGSIRLSGGIVDFTGTKGTSTHVLTTDGTNAYWAEAPGSAGLASAAQSVVRDTFIGNSAASSYSLSETPLGEQFVIVTINGIVQENAAYNVSGSSLVFDEPLANTDVVEARIFKPYNPHMVDSSVSYVTTTPGQVLDTFSSTVYRTAKYVVQLANTTSYQASEVLLIHDGTQVFTTEYSQIFTGSALGTIDADISGGNVRLLVSPSFSNVTAKAIRYSIGV